MAQTVFQGTVRKLDVEGGVWVLRTATAQYLLAGMPAEFLMDGLEVRVSGRAEAAFGIAMVGDTLHVESASRT